tara:strand:- start:58 stop:732 length:675 start_codon:yes stop_codon:yes gene_type:complete
MTKRKNSEAAAGLPVDTYKHLQAAFDHFNAALFGGELPPAMLTINTSKRNCHGYAWQDRFEHVETGAKVSEISMNPDSFARGLREAMGTFVHEMAHHWEHTCSRETVSRGGYHNKTWANKMESVGLMPSDNGQPGGKRTGQSVTHYIISDGPFAAAFDAMPASIKLDWHGISQATPTRKRPKANKIKYQCSECGANAWGKLGLGLACVGEEGAEHSPVLMQAAE